MTLSPWGWLDTLETSSSLYDVTIFSESLLSHEDLIYLLFLLFSLVFSEVSCKELLSGESPPIYGTVGTFGR